jgi:peptidoglycan/xylan/chitin deacetylase (PgdA/CDA1 family)
MKKHVLVTTSWDDGHKLDLKLARLLNKYGIRGTFYISPNNREFNKMDLLSDSEIIEISKNFEIGAHTLTHPRLSTVSSVESYDEISGSRQYLEMVTGRRIVSFSYPGGDYDSTHVSQVKKAGFKLARTTKRFAGSIGEKRYEIPTSIHAYKHWSDIKKIATISNFDYMNFFKYFSNWDQLAIVFFNHIMQNGQIFHLWGHSWEIEKHNDWDKLEKVLKHIANRRNVMYGTNAELL